MRHMLSVFIKVFTAALLAIGLCAHFTPAAQANSDPDNSVTVNNSSATQVWKEVQKYIILVDGDRIFDETAAQQAGASEDVIEAGRLYNQMVEDNKNNFRGISIPIWGNWCGPGHGGESGDPIDELDTACMHHDLCYAAQGYFSCDCDQRLIDEIDMRWTGMKTNEKVMAVATKGFFTIGKLWCKQYPQAQKQPSRLTIKQNAWVVARYEISWDEVSADTNGTRVHKTWSSNNRDRTLKVIDTLEFPPNATNLKVSIRTHTGLFWAPWKTVFTADDLKLVPQRTIELKGTAFRIWVLNNER